MPVRFDSAALKARILAAVAEEAEASILTKAQEYIPRDTDTAHDSGKVMTERDTVFVSFGSYSDRNPKTGEASNTYIELLEEDSAAVHPHGQSHFLARARDESQTGFAERVARRARL